MFEMSIPVNRFLVPETINGTCTAYAYTNEDEYEAGGRPVIYSDNGNKPLVRKSKQEGLIDFRVTGSKPKGWRSTAFSSNGSITSGSYIWFGIFAEYYWFPRFDYGARCYTDWWWDYGMEETIIPDEYPLYNANYYEDFKLSMYFTYSSAQNYTHTLTQGVKLTDTRKLTASYKRAISMKANGVTPSQKRVFNEIRLAEEIKMFRPFHEEGNDIAFRFPVKNTVVFKRSIIKDGKPVGTLAAPIHKSPPVPPEGKALVIRGNEAKTCPGPAGKSPRRGLIIKRYPHRKIIEALPECYWPRIVISHSICKVSLDVTFTAGLICA
jgi:hypothetical protein